MASVVIAEDNLEHQRAIAEVVRRLGHEASVAADGRTALAVVAEQRPDLVIADVDMPDIDGLQMCRAMRSDPRLAAVPVVLITAYLSPGDPRMTAAGATAVMGKPFSMKELTDTLRAYLDGRRPVPAPAVPGTPATAVAVVDGPHRDIVTGEGDGETAFVDALLDSLGVAVVACDTGGRLVASNPALRMFIGDDIETVRVQDWPQRFGLRHHDGTPVQVADLPLIRALAGEHIHQAGLRAQDRRGRQRWFSVDARPVRDANGATLGAVAAVHDVTADHRARQYQDCLFEVLDILAGEPRPDTAERVLSAVAAALGWPNLSLWLVDAVTDRLQPAAHVTGGGALPLRLPSGLARGEGLAGLCWQRGEPVWVPDLRADDSPVLTEILPPGGYRSAGAVPVRRGADVKGIVVFFSADRQEPDPALGVLLTGIAGHLGAHLERRRSDELARQLSASAQEYIALVGHELRTPLTSIAAYTDLITEAPDPTPIGEVRDLLEVVTRNNARLRDVVDQLLDLATLESDYASLTMVTVDLAAVVAAGVAAVTPAAAEHGITVHTDLPPGLPLTGDADRLRQVVDSLIGNAIKFSPDGATVTITAAVRDEAAELTVTDAGIGVPDDDRPHLFRRLFRAGNARHSGIPGAGLGLALSRAIVERHHGSITLVPAEPAGTTVTVRLPLLHHGSVPPAAAPAM
jgi:PAS domain S-box-containing protein